MLHPLIDPGPEERGGDSRGQRSGRGLPERSGELFYEEDGQTKSSWAHGSDIGRGSSIIMTALVDRPTLVHEEGRVRVRLWGGEGSLP
jgi:hypothetical protein